MMQGRGGELFHESVIIWLTEMDDKFINPFSESLINVLGTMAMLQVRAGAPSVKTHETAHGDVTGIIGMTGEQAKGSFAVTFTEPVILEITRRMLGEEVNGIDETVTDMVGEITNMVTGGAKKFLSEKGYRFDMAVPAVIAGPGHVIRHKSGKPVIIVPFSTEAGEFFMETCFEELR